MAVDVVIVAFRSDPALLDKSVASVLNSTASGRLLVYVNAVTDALAHPGPLAQAAASPQWSLRWEAHLDNRGFCGANNRGVDWFNEGSSTHLLVLNPDVILERQCITQLRSFLEAEGGGMAGPLLRRLSADGLLTDRIDSAGIHWTSSGRHLDRLAGERLDLAPSAPFEVKALTGAAMMVDRASVQRLTMGQCGELFDQTFFAYREDAELGLRATALEIPIRVVPAAAAWHERQLKGTDRRSSARANRLSVQNRFLIRYKYGRARPGKRLHLVGRDLSVIGAVIAIERESLAGLRSAFAIRRYTRRRGQGLRPPLVRGLATSGERESGLSGEGSHL